VIIQACDPGLNGAFARFDISAGTLDVVDMPTVEVTKRREVNEQLANEYIGDCDHFFIEKQSARPGQGVSSMFKLGVNYGIVKGIVAAQQIPITVVTPQKWRNACHVPSGKDGSRARAAQLFPMYADLFSRRKDDGRADAALIAFYGAVFFDALDVDFVDRHNGD